MCGIVGYIGKREAVPFLLDGLSKLEYRGYDSTGIAVSLSDRLEIVKKRGHINNIKELVDTRNYSSNVGIGHTRWATHGNPTDDNSHPHVSDCGKIAVVHNGIIENYIELKEKLISNGCNFNSETDSEVVARHIGYLYKNNKNILDCVFETVKILQGSFALCIICQDFPDKLIVVKKDSPLIVGVSQNENYIASDVPALLSYTKEICRLPEKSIAIVTSEDFELYDFDRNILEKKLDFVDWSVDSAEKSGYDYFMMKEIMEQTVAVRSTISPRLDLNNNIKNKIRLDNINFSQEYLNSLKKICIIACGSAYHVGCVAKYFIEEILRIPVEVDLASEFRYRDPIVENSLVIVISQSGETADSLAGLREAKKLGARVISIVNVFGSSIATESDDVLYTYAGPEIAVATTKAYSTQLVSVYLLTLKLCELLQKNINNKIIQDIREIPDKINQVLELENIIKKIAKKYYKFENVFFIGRNIDYAVCMEGSLKLKEISYVHSEAYAAGELKHGTISLIDDNTLVVALATQSKLVDKMISNVREVRARGAKVLFITTEKYQAKLQEISEDIIIIPEILDILSASLSVIPLQFFAYYIALYRGCNIDKPKNLAKSVTVE